MSTIDPKWAWARYEPSAQHAWDLGKAGHLYRRAGFRPVRCWGEYAESITSVCFEKTIEGEPQR